MSMIPEPIQFAVEILLAELLVSHWLQRRRYWPAALAGTLAAMALISLLWPESWNGWFKMAKYLAVFLVSVAGLWAVCRVSFWEALYHGMAAYAAQHTAFNLNGLITYNLLRVSTPEAVALVSLLCYAAVYLAIYLLFVRKIRRDGLFGVDNRFLSCFVVIMLLAVIVLNFARMSSSDQDGMLWNLCASYAILCCVFALFIQSGMYQQSQLSRRLDISQHLLHSQEQQYRVSEATIQSINLKCHDLKHQVVALRRSMTGPGVEQALGELESTVQVYDSAVKTGNEALDVTLTEKSLFCEKNQIQLTCMVDASGLTGISDSDLYSLFGNLLDNAIESVLELSEPELRTIGLTVKNTGGMTLIHTENYFDHPIRMENGLPLTTKADKQYHGFGMQSIRLLAERYGGTLSIQTDGNIFNVNILLPVPPRKVA